MKILRYIRTVITKPRLLGRYDRLLLLSHMRANTSLLGHVLGSHPEINGYYELHIGYYSWKSFIRQKLTYCREHTIKKNSRYIFDKVLHNDHFVNTALFQAQHSKIIIMLREPCATINSIINLYKKNDPYHKFATIEGAVSYYSFRLEQLCQLSEQFRGRYLYMDAEAITQTTDSTLLKLTSWLGLKYPLTKEYQIFQKTGKKKAGDSSNKMMSGIIQKKQAPKNQEEIPQDLNSKYQKIREILISRSKKYILFSI